MKITNFINPVSPADERSCATWFRLSLMLAVVTIACITYIQISQLMIWSSYRQEYKKYSNATKQYAQFTEEKNKLMAREQMFKNKMATIINTSDQSCKRIEQLNSLYKACTQDMHLSSCSFTTDGATITLNCSTIEHAQAFSTALNKSRQFTDLKITSICPHKKSINMTLKSVMK